MARNLSLRIYLAALIAAFAAALAVGSPATAASQQVTRCQPWNAYLETSSCISTAGRAASAHPIRAAKAKPKPKGQLLLCRKPYTSTPVKCR